MATQRRITLRMNKKVKLVGRIQHHMMKTYIKYIENPLVKEDAEKHNNIKGTNTGAVGIPSILPEQLGHEVQTHGNY
eukprot:9657329-Heterocapsa_arctica.AAC.1